ncbi:MAG: acetyltransferase [Rhodocyclaceae bacterium]|jgi:sugar O-acyltransferase (sialic acid O-acetyltransferase NeuD family)|nr:acetyltransferase [Rhodocyclaceae bacterium]MCA3025655.1 acetyltransferase [Rhodocyclaceae bacterium]MCA3029320.1 acetyltransferase [Rhodocyclaceae bacterium]MCA3030802.1 acetyltransferase [Rhodocyclaceae bacterium]MCA3034031.1 acetyltransferase [Rhodocyclaceae bacterium]
MRTSSKPSLFVYCAGGYGKEVMDVANRFNTMRSRWQSISFIDDVCKDDVRYGAKVFDFAQMCEFLARNAGEVIIANGEPAARVALRNRLEENGIRLGQLVDNSSIVVPTARLAAGVIVAPLCSISSDADLGTNVSVNTMSIVGHDVVVGENTVISSMVNIGGSSIIGKDCYIGMGALIKEGIKIGHDVIIGMGSVVYSDIPDNVIALGNPARAARPNADKRVFK